MTHAQNVILVFALLCNTLGAEKYTSKWDNLDIEQILHSSRLLENYKKCLMDEGNCTPEGSELKKEYVMRDSKEHMNTRDELYFQLYLCRSLIPSRVKECLKFSGHLGDALKTECSKCTSKQKSNAEKIINYMIENKQEWWKELEKKFDPTGIYYKRYLQHHSKSKGGSSK